DKVALQVVQTQPAGGIAGQKRPVDQRVEHVLADVLVQPLVAPENVQHRLGDPRALGEHREIEVTHLDLRVQGFNANLDGLEQVGVRVAGKLKAELVQDGAL